MQGGNVSATVKHFAAYASPEQGLNTGPVHGGERELRTTYLPSYKRQIIDAGAYSIMSAYSSYDGVVCVYKLSPGRALRCEPDFHLEESIATLDS